MRGFLPFLLLLGACNSGIEVGDYAVFVVAYSELEESESCYPDGRPLNQVGDSSTFQSGGTFAIFAAAEDTYLLEMDGLVMRGTLTEETFNFNGTSVDVEFFGYDDDNRTSIEIATKVDITVDKLAMSGSSESQIDVECVGPDCGDPAATTCTQTSNFSGSLVEDVELKHEI